VETGTVPVGVVVKAVEADTDEIGTGLTEANGTVEGV
jgi:hypothetical protein